MAAGIGYVGREALMTVGGSGLIGVITKNFTLNNEPVEVTDDNSAGWSEHLAIAGVKSVELSIDGIMKNLELVAAYFASTNSNSQIFALTFTWPDGSVMSGDFFMASIENGNESNEGATFSATFQSSGAVTFTPGT